MWWIWWKQSNTPSSKCGAESPKGLLAKLRIGVSHLTTMPLIIRTSTALAVCTNTDILISIWGMPVLSAAAISWWHITYSLAHRWAGKLREVALKLREDVINMTVDNVQPKWKTFYIVLVFFSVSASRQFWGINCFNSPLCLNASLPRPLILTGSSSNGRNTHSLSWPSAQQLAFHNISLRTSPHVSKSPSRQQEFLSTIK